ncbi:MAG: helix-turn-helix transcriptional regulator [Balneolaceae bacterium]
MSDRALMEQMGVFVKHHRLQQNKTQEEVATEAGISRSTLSLLERGETVTMTTWIQVLRVLDQLHVMNSFRVQEAVSPIALAQSEKEKRQRARKKNPQDQETSEW